MKNEPCILQLTDKDGNVCLTLFIFFYFVHPKFLPIEIQFEYRDDDRGWKGVVWEGWDET